MGVIFVLSLCYAPDCQRLLDGNSDVHLVLWFLHLVPAFAAAAQGMPLDLLVLVTMGLAFLDPMAL